MITRVQLQLRLPEGEPFRPSLAYALYGALCARMDPELAEGFHAQRATPVRQHLRAGPGGCQWVLDLFGPAQPLAQLLCGWGRIPLDCLRAPVEVLGCAVSQPVGVPDLLAACGRWPQGPLAQISFETPCTFKVAGDYARFPTAELVAQSLFLRWNALMPECAMEDGDALRMLAAGLSISRYHLQSQDYRLKGQRIPGFVGELQLLARLPAPLMELWRLLLAFAPYGGVGVKTALGMGAVGARVLAPRRQGGPQGPAQAAGKE